MGGAQQGRVVAGSVPPLSRSACIRSARGHPPGENERMIATAPQGPVEPPPIVTALAAGRPVRAVWENEVGGLTFQVGVGDARQFVKWTPTGSGIDLGAEAARLCWAVRYTTVPLVLDEGADGTGTWIVTQGLPGRMAVDDHWKRDPGTAVRAIGTGLRALHDALPVADCPFDWSAERRLESARSRAAAGRIHPTDWHHDLQHLGTAERALDVLADIRPSTDSSSATATPALPTPWSVTTARGPGTSTSGRSESPTAGPTSPWPPGARSGTTARDGKSRCSKPMASSRTGNGSTTTDCCGTCRTEHRPDDVPSPRAPASHVPTAPG